MGGGDEQNSRVGIHKNNGKHQPPQEYLGKGSRFTGAASVVGLAGCHGDRHIFAAEDPPGSLMGYAGRGLRYAFLVGDPTLS